MEDVVWRFTDFARAFVHDAPLYSQFAARVAREPDIVSLMQVAAPTQRIPVLLFAGVHYLLLAEPHDPLAVYYPNMQPVLDRRPQSSLEPRPVVEPITAAGDEFVRFVRERAETLSAVLATRSTQTNEVGRCSWFVFPLALLETEHEVLARVDIGSSAGLTLLFSHLAYDIRPGHLVEPRLSREHRLVLRCDVRNQPPIPATVPQVNWSMGLDLSPIDVRDDDQVRWLEACVWAEKVDRFQRLGSAVAMARELEIEVEQGDAVATIHALVERASAHGHPVVTTSWVLNYLTAPQRIEFVAELDRIGSQRDLSWIIAESPRETPELPVVGRTDEDITVISLVTWRRGNRSSQRLATTHPHGSWINWGA